jgi:cardiolipin synthase
MLVRHASAATYEELAAAGVCIALREGGLLHTKSLVVDGETSVFGSVNLDMRSLYLNFEISLFVYDRAFAGRLRALQDRYLESAPQLDLEAWRRRPALRRFQENLVRLIGPLL